jgi:hypothetical protein
VQSKAPRFLNSPSVQLRLVRYTQIFLLHNVGYHSENPNLSTHAQKAVSFVYLGIEEVRKSRGTCKLYMRPTSTHAHALPSAAGPRGSSYPVSSRYSCFSCFCLFNQSILRCGEHRGALFQASSSRLFSWNLLSQNPSSESSIYHMGATSHLASKLSVF